MAILGRRGGMLEVHCEDPVLIDAAVASALQHGDTAPRHHAATRSTEAEAVATHRAMAFARATDAPVHVVHLSCAAALRQVAEARAAGARATAETCPHYLALTDARYDELDPIECAKSVISPPLRSAADRDRGRFSQSVADARSSACPGWQDHARTLPGTSSCQTRNAAD